MTSTEEWYANYMKKPYLVRKFRELSSNMRRIRSRTHTMLFGYRLEGYKFPLLRLATRPLRHIAGFLAWRSLTTDQKNAIHDALVVEAQERGYDNFMAHGSAWANENSIRQENGVAEIVKSLGI